MKYLYAAADLIEATGLAEIGVTLFVGDMPADVHRGVMLRDPLYGADLDEEQDGFTKHQFQVIVRDVDPDAAWDKAWAIGNALKVQNHSRSGIFISKMHPISYPATYPKMESDELETSINIRVWFALA